MKARRLFVPLLILGLTLPAPLGSSDFSQLGEPAFARSLMISPERHVELDCAALAYLPYRTFEVFDIMDEPTDEMIEKAEEALSVPPYSEKMIASKNMDEPPTKYEPILAPPPSDMPEAPGPQFDYEKLLTEGEAERLKAAVISRLFSDVGDEKMAQQSLEQRFWAFEVPDWEPSEENVAERKARRDAAAATCQTIFAAVRASNLESTLSPPSAAPIPLMDVDTCLAYDLIAQKSPDYGTYSILADDRGDELYTALIGPKGPKRKAYQNKIAALAAGMGEVDPRFAVTKSFPCLATYVIEMKKKPEFWEATE